MTPMYVLTVKADGGTQDVLGFYGPGELSNALALADGYLRTHQNSRRAIIRLEWYNPEAPQPARKP